MGPSVTAPVGTHGYGAVRQAAAHLITFFLLLVASAACVAPAALAAPSEGTYQWDPLPYTPGSAKYTELTQVLPGPADSVYVTGRYEWMFPAGQALAARLHADTGTPLWSKPLNGPRGKDATCAAATTDGAGNLVMAGASPGFMGDLWVAKLSAAGVVRWSRRWDGTARKGDGARAVAVAAGGAVYAAGTTVGTRSGEDGVIVKYGADGRFKWAWRLKTPRSTRSDGLVAAALDRFGNVYATGWYRATRTGGARRLVLVKVSSAGRLQWMRTVSAVGGSAEGHAVFVRGNDVTVLGRRSSTPSWKCMVGRYSLRGAKRWFKVDDQPIDAFGDAAVDASGRLYVAGSYEDAGHTAKQLGCLYVFQGGVRIAAATFFNDQAGDHDGPAEFLGVATDAAGRVYVAGRVGHDPGEYSSSEALALLYDAPASVPWEPQVRWRLNGLFVPGTNRYADVLVSGSSGVFVAGCRAGAAPVTTQGAVQQLVVPAP